MGKGLVYQVGEARSVTTPCESGACINITKARDEGEVMLTETANTRNWVWTDLPSVVNFLEKGPRSTLEEPGPDDNIDVYTYDDGMLSVFDVRNRSSLDTTAENLANFKKYMLVEGGLGELATATAVQELQYA